MKIYYSQFGEDKYLNEECNLPKTGIFVDVGAGGIENSNSYFFEQKGWTVLCIEPDKRHEDLDKRKLVDNSVVGDQDGKVDFVFHRFPQLSGLYHGKVEATNLPMYKLDTILEKYKIDKIDILSIDVEGHELKVLDGFNIDKYKPSYMIIEHTNQFKGNGENDVCSKLKCFGYQVIYRTQSNLVMKRNLI